MDSVDKKILAQLQANARISNADIARSVGMAPSGVLERVRKLEENGFIEKYNAKLNAEKLRLGLLAFVFVRTNESPGDISAAEKFSNFPEVLEVHHVAGEDCFMLKIRLADNKALAVFMREKLGPLQSIVSTRTVIVLETVKETSDIPLSDDTAL